jgi:MscS family membrane protein
MRVRVVLPTIVVASVLVGAPSLALAHHPDPPAASASAHAAPEAPAQDDAAPDSPRASVRRFMELCHAGEFAEAASYLDVPEARNSEGRELARRLHAILDRQLWGKIESISGASLGDANDHLPAGVDVIGTIRGASGPEPIRLVHRFTPEGARWIFSRATVEHIDDWYAHMRGRWQDEWIPRPLLGHGPKDVLWWQWIALPILFGLSLAGGWLLGSMTRIAIGRALNGRKVPWHDGLLRRLGAPLTLAWAVAGVDLAVPYLQLYPAAQTFIDALSRAGYFLSGVWFVERCVDIGAARILENPTAKNNPAARSLVPLAAKSTKVVLLIFAVLAGLSQLGVAVGSLIAGLGIGGVALALAAQKTVENLFGSFSIGVDQPFRVGDFVTVDTISGTVESIGLRSTRIRTLDRTLVTFPNGKLADMRVESFAARDRIKFACVLPLDRATSAAAIRAVVEEGHALLAAHPKIWPEPSVVFAKVSDASLDVEILAWFQTTSWDEFLAIRGELLLGLMDVVEKAGAKLATPTPTPPKPK